MKKDEFTLCSIDIPELFDEEGDFDLPKAYEVHQCFEGFIKRIRKTLPGKNTIPANAARRGVLYENIHWQTIINDGSLMFTVLIKDTSPNLELELGDALIQLANLVREYFADAIQAISSTKSSSIYVASPGDVATIPTKLESMSAILQARDQHDVDMKIAALKVVNALPQGSKIELYSKNTLGEPIANSLNTPVRSEHILGKLRISAATRQALAEDAPFPVSGVLIGHLWKQTKVFIKCDDQLVQSKGISVGSNSDLSYLKEAYCKDDRVSLSIQRDGDRGYQLISIADPSSD